MTISNPHLIVRTLLGITAILWGLTPLLATSRGRRTNGLVWSIAIGLGAAAVLIAAVVVFVFGTQNFSLPRPFSLGSVRVGFRADLTAAWFLGIIGITSGAIAPYLRGYFGHMPDHVDLRLIWVALPWLLLSMVLVVLAANAVTFLIVWELMSLTSFLLVAADHEPHANRQAALTYLGATRAGTALLAGGFLWAHALTGSWWFTDWHLHGSGALGPGLLVLAGLGVKAGMWPFHLWLPIAHPAAPTPVSAVMSGVMVKVAIAAMVRLFVVDNSFVNPAFGYLLLVLGSIGAIWAILFAVMQDDLKRLLAFSTIENVGLILLGLGGSIAARRLGLPTVASIALAASLFHSLNHSLFKSALFLGSGSIDMGAGTRNMGKLGGLGHRMPWTYATFVIGAIAACGLPPLNGFASEWLLYRGSLGIAGAAIPPAIRFCGLGVIGLISVVGTVALACFVKAIGVTFLGRSRSTAAANAQECSRGMRFSVVALACGCTLLGLAPTLVLRVLSPICAAASPNATPLILAWTLPTGAMISTLIVVFLCIGTLRFELTRRFPVRPSGTWDCGFGDLSARSQISGVSFVQPIARMFKVLFQYSEGILLSGRNRRLFPDEITSTTSSGSILETQVYRPAALWISRVGDRILWLQEGSIHRYLMTMFLVLMVLLAIGGHLR